jgi:hypothetical protein
MSGDGVMSGPARHIADARPQARVAVTGTITAARTVTVGTSPAYLCRLADDTGQLDLLFLGRAGVPGLRPGARCAVDAMAGTHRGRLTAWNPRYQLICAESEPGRAPAIQQPFITPRRGGTQAARRVLAPR